VARDASKGQLDPAQQSEIRDFARRLPEMDLYAVLAVEQGVGDEAIREAFFERSRAYHPDRHFGKDLGSYGELLTEIFKRVTTAYEVLRDAELRRSYDRSLGASPRPVSPAASEAPQAPKAPAETRARPAAPRRPSRAVLRSLQRQLELTRAKARRHFEEALELRNGGNLERAHAMLRLALIFDPHEPTYQNAFGEIAMGLDQSRAPATPGDAGEST
jgi:curved DNA-binding protein CbpA